MIRVLIGTLFVALLAFGAPSHSFAQTCTGGCPTGYSCQYDASHVPQCVQDCQNGSGTSNCTIDELTVTAPSRGMDFAGAVNSIIKFFDAYVIPFLYAIAFVVFLVGIFRFFFTGGEEGRQKARPFVFWGLVGLFIIFSVWGIVNLLLSALPRA